VGTNQACKSGSETERASPFFQGRPSIITISNISMNTYLWTDDRKSRSSSDWHRPMLPLLLPPLPLRLPRR
jgi:hypothetical protein